MEVSIKHQFLQVLDALNYNINDAVHEFLHFKIVRKISEFKSENLFYSNKYEMNFNDFEKSIEELENEENINAYDDYLAWKFAQDSLDYYENQLKKIK